MLYGWYWELLIRSLSISLAFLFTFPPGVMVGACTDILDTKTEPNAVNGEAVI